MMDDFEDLLVEKKSKVFLTKLSSKGQIVLPKALREILGLRPGEVFAMFGDDDTIVLKRIVLPSEKEFEKLLKWGKAFAKKEENLQKSRKNVLKAVEEMREKGG